jgi:hypothetical protein
MCHGRILDTVALFPHPRGLPHKPKLKLMAQRVSVHGVHSACIWRVPGWLQR